MACTSQAGMVGDRCMQTKHMSKNIFALADEISNPATNIAILEQKVIEPARTVNMVP